MKLNALNLPKVTKLVSDDAGRDDFGYRHLLAPETRERLEALLDFSGRQEELTKKRRKEIQASR